MTLRAVTKSKRSPRLITCPACDGRMESVDVTVYNRYGEPSQGFRMVHVPCERCNSSGKVKRGLEPACCCSGPAADRCEGCANARRGGAEIHNCSVATSEELNYEAALAFADTPRTTSGTAGRDSSAADLGVGERSGQR